MSNAHKAAYANIFNIKALKKRVINENHHC